MKKIAKILTLVLCMAMVLSVAAFAAGETYTKVTDDTLASGTYVIVAEQVTAKMDTDGDGKTDTDVTADYALQQLDEGWVTVSQATLSGDSVSADAQAVWTLTVVDGGVKIQDSDGQYIAPKGGNSNGIIEGEYVWSYACVDGKYVFGGQGEDTVQLAVNVGSQARIRAYKNGTIEKNPEGYPNAFALYKQSESGTAGGNTPVTGDTSVIMLAVCAMMASAGAIVLLQKKRAF